MLAPISLLLALSIGTTTLTVKGSDTIGGELGPALGRAYEASHPAVRVAWEGLGSATAFPGLFDGSADLGAASRPVDAKELAEAKQLGISLQEYVLGYDGIAVIVNPINPVHHLTVEQLSALFAGRLRTWSDVGGADQPVKVVSRPSYSGTHAFFKERVLRQGRKEATDEFAPGTIFIEKSDEVVREVARDPGAIAYVGMGRLRPGISIVAVSAGAGKPYLVPTQETVRNGEYAIYRPLLLYTRGDPRGETRRFLAYVLGEEGRRLVAAHEFTPSDAAPLLPDLAEPEVAPSAPRSRVYRVRFDYGRATVDAEGLAILESVRAEASRMGARVLLVGNADAAGDVEANRRMARVRAERVAKQLVRMGIPREDLVIDVHGSDTPLASNTTGDGRRANRRVDIEVVPRR